MNSPNRITPIIYGTAVMTLIAVFPVLNLINVFCCAGIILGGYAGVYVYWKQLQNTGLTLTIKDGGMIGILCGILSAIFVTGFGLLLSLFSDSNPMIEIMKTFDDIGFQMPPEMSQYLDKFSEEYNEHGFSPTITIFSFISNMILYPLFGSIGAILGVSFLNKKTMPKV
ncbi:MAG TPA: hypothetical protein PKC91_12690 [Ignavibacteria bacterium]|nr:hypothetical protein [Ignavibacteria bacterium]